MKILLVEDDELLVELLMKALTAQHYIVEVATDGQAGWELADSYPYDLILLDVVLPRLDGISVCRRLRSHNYPAPILLLTAKDTSTNKVMGLDAGADDYVTKPFDLPELLARVRALLRRGSTNAPSLLKWGDLELDPTQCKVTYQQQIIPLTPKEYGLLQLFLHNPNRIFSCGSLIDHLWSFEEPPTEETVRSHVKGLRHKLKVAHVTDDPIETVYGIGYRLKPGKDHAAPAAEIRNATEVETEIQSIWQQVKENLTQRVAIIQEAARAAQDRNLTETLRETAEKTAHKLIGSLGMFGSDQGSELAQQLEKLFQIKTRLRPPQAKKLLQLTNALQQALQEMQGESSLLEEPEPPPEPLPKLEARVLAVDDDPTILTGLQKLLTPWGLQVIVLHDPTQYLEILTATSPDLIILDEEMPILTGTELCRMTRNLPQGQELPILFLTAHKDAETLDRIFSVGADDFVSKPLIGPELVVRVVHRLERSRWLRHHSEIDPLTGVANRQQSSQALLKLLRQETSGYVAVIVLEQLKQINLQWGHAIADQVLCHFGNLLQTALPEPAIVGRWGGAEFVVGFSQSLQPATLRSLVHIVTTLEQQSFAAPAGILTGVTCQVGLAAFPQDGKDGQTLYRTAINQLAPIEIAIPQLT